nr:ankyrin repeat-containing protein NPR4-like [Ziziphus jujuba var. spinosa]
MDSQSFNVHLQVPQQTDDDIITIDHQLYKAAVMGQISAFEQHKDHLHRLLTRGRNTVLHIHLKNRLSFVKQMKIFFTLFFDVNEPITMLEVNFVEKILEICPTLLKQQNHVGETPVHVAAKYGDFRAVKLLIDRCEKRSIGCKLMLLRMKNNAGDTALHESLMGHKRMENTVQWGNYSEVAKILSEDIEFMNDRNAAGETPLYPAVKARFYPVVGQHGCTYDIYLLWNRCYSEKEERVMQSTDDEKGWVPLHYAAKLGRKYALEKLLKYDPFAAGIKDKKGQIPLQVIADPDICRSFIKIIISKSPDCCELLTIDEKICHDDRKAATQFDRLAAQFGRQVIKCLSPSHITKSITCEFEEETEYAFKIWTKTFNDGKKPDEDKLLDRESTLVVATLIATVTFAAGFTFPGGYVSGGDNLPSSGGSQPGAAGSAVLSENAAFKAFLLSDAIAMALSCCAVFIHLFLALKKDRTKDRSYFMFAFKLIIVAMVVMVVAFMTGIYAVLGSSNAFAIASCVFISVSILLCILGLTFGYFTDYVYSVIGTMALGISIPFLLIFTLVIYPSCLILVLIAVPIVFIIVLIVFYIKMGRQLSNEETGNLEILLESNVNPRTPSINEESAKLSEMANNSEAEKGGRRILIQ